MDAASPALPRAFCPEKSRPELRYGEQAGQGEHFRGVGALVHDEAGEAACERMRKEVEESCCSDGGPAEGGGRQELLTFDRNPAIFADVGGPHLWRELSIRLRTGR